MYQVFEIDYEECHFLACDAMWNIDDEGSRFLQEVADILLGYTASHPKRQ
jgi:hypothetical protein